MTRFRVVLATLVSAVCLSGVAHAELTEISIARQPSLGHLPLMIMQDRNLLEKNAAARGVAGLKVNYLTLAGGAAMNDALLSGSIQFAAGGVPPLVVLWAKTRDTPQAVKGVAAMNSMPLIMNTNRPSIHTLKDFGPGDKIALPAVKVSIQAIFLQMAAEHEFGAGHANDLDRLTVTLSHPDGERALLSNTEVAAHFTAAPSQERELRRPGIHTVLNSYDVLGGPSTFNVVWASQKFRDANPQIFAAFLQSLDEAIAIINADKTAAAASYARLAKDGTDPALIETILRDPHVSFTTTPQAIKAMGDFMARTHLVQATMLSWKDLFFSESTAKDGS